MTEWNKKEEKGVCVGGAGGTSESMEGRDTQGKISRSCRASMKDSCMFYGPVFYLWET